MNKLEMCKAIAKLEGEKHWIGHTDCVFIEVSGLVGSNCDKYNPIDNLALNCLLRDKYKVSVEYAGVSSFCAIGEGAECTLVDFCVDTDIARAVIECILKANNLWVES